MFLLELEILEGAKIYSRVFTLYEGGNILVGRQQCDLTLSDRSVSRKHLSFQVRRAKLMVTDLKSTSGTKRNGEPIQQTYGQKGDVFEVGPYLVRLRKFTASRRAEPTLDLPPSPTAGTSTFLIPLVGPKGIVPQALNRLSAALAKAKGGFVSRGWRIAATAAVVGLVAFGAVHFGKGSPQRDLASAPEDLVNQAVLTK